MTDLPRAAPPDWKQQLIRSLMFVAFIGALGYAAAYGGFGLFEDDIHLALEPNRDSVQLTGSEPPVIQVKVSLRNNTREDVTLKAPSACKMFRWQIFDRSGDMLQSKVSEDTCPNTEVVAILPPGERLEEFYAIALVPARFRAGDDYLVHYWYWGYEGQFQFKAE